MSSLPAPTLQPPRPSHPTPPHHHNIFLFFFLLACFRSVEMSQSGVSEQSCNSGSNDQFQGPLGCICALPCSANQKCLRDVNEQCFTAQHTAGAL